MSNHSREFPNNDMEVFNEILREEAKKLSLGETHNFPFGKLTESDEGELRFGVAADKTNGKVIINFGKSVAWFAMTAQDAKDLANTLLQKANELP